VRETDLPRRLRRGFQEVLPRELHLIHHRQLDIIGFKTVFNIDKFMGIRLVVFVLKRFFLLLQLHFPVDISFTEFALHR
jgi:hypothetical protein